MESSKISISGDKGPSDRHWREVKTTSNWTFTYVSSGGIGDSSSETSECLLFTLIGGFLTRSGAQTRSSGAAGSHTFTLCPHQTGPENISCHDLKSLD